MTTLFDIGDKITFKMTGTVEEYTNSRNGDCYRIKIKSDNPHNDGIQVYLESEALLAAKATLVR